MAKKYYSGIFWIFVFMCSCYKEIEVPQSVLSEYDYQLYFNNMPVAFDMDRKMILCSVNPEDLGEWEVQIKSSEVNVLAIEGTGLTSDNKFFFNSIDTHKPYPVTLRLPGNIIAQYILQFTTLPLLQIFTENQIPDEPEVPAWIIISSGIQQEKMKTSYIGIERRGGSNYGRPKHSFKIEFWDDEYESGHTNPDLFGLTPDDDWILDAMYIDKARMRNRLSFDIWEDIQKDRLTDFNIRKTGVDGVLVELFVNNNFLGIYHFSESIDGKQLDIQPPREQVEGVIYKALEWDAPTMYTGLYELNDQVEWGGWKLVYPKDYVDTAWYPLYNYLDFAINSTDENFTRHIFDYIDINSIIDYYILLNISVAGDNWGKNIILTRSSSISPFLFLPWDMDGTWGRGWDSTCTSSNAILANNLYNRLFQLNPFEFKQKLVDRWEYLKMDVLKEFAVTDRIEMYREIYAESGAFDREKILWPEMNLDLSGEVEYMKDWIHKRIGFLNEYFDSLEE